MSADYLSHHPPTDTMSNLYVKKGTRSLLDSCCQSLRMSGQLLEGEDEGRMKARGEGKDWSVNSSKMVNLLQMAVFNTSSPLMRIEINKGHFSLKRRGFLFNHGILGKRPHADTLFKAVLQLHTELAYLCSGPACSARHQELQAGSATVPSTSFSLV